MMLVDQANLPTRVLVSHGLGETGVWVQELAASLRPVGVEVVGIAGPTATVDRLSSLRPGVVVVDDVSLTGAGWGLLRRIHRLDHRLPCLLVVRRAEPRLLSRALELSAYSVFESPVDTELMGQMVCRLLRRPLGTG